MSDSRPKLDAWIPRPAVRVSHQRRSTAPAERLWRSSRELRLADTRLLGRLVRWRIPDIPAGTTFEQLFSNEPFAVLEEGELSLLSGIVGRIWTLRRDYPTLASPADFRDWSQAGTVRVLFANWVEVGSGDENVLRSETRIEPFGVQGRLGLASIRPLIRGFQQLIVTDAMGLAARRAEGRG